MAAEVPLPALLPAGLWLPARGALGQKALAVAMVIATVMVMGDVVEEEE